MQKKSWRIILILLVTGLVIFAGLAIRNRASRQKQARPNVPTLVQKHPKTVPKKQRERFINQIATPAIKQYRRDRRILPSVVIAQAILESRYGTSQLYRAAKNPFGIKGAYEGNSVAFYTREVIKGKSVQVLANFRKYPSLRAAILDHNRLVEKKFIKQKNIVSYRTSTRMLQENGYATDPKYASKLNHLIVKYRLSRYDLKAINE